MRFIKLKFVSTQRGQVAVLYAILFPLLFFIFGITVDLGWYYLNVSRLQNAADAAALAGAQIMLEDDETFKEYTSLSLVKNYPNSPNYSYETEEEILADIEAEAVRYVAKNLSSAGSLKEGDYYILNDGWSVGGKSKVNMDSSLFEDEDGIYYVVHVQESIRHFLLPGLFGDMNAPVTAIVLIRKQEKDDSADDD